MYQYRILRLFLLIIIINIIILSNCFAGGNSIKKENKEKTDAQRDIITVSEVQVGMRLVCTDFTERLVKNTQDEYDTRYIVTITGVVTVVRNSEVEIKVETITSENLRRDNSAWVIDDSVLKRPPYNPGDTYVCKPQKTKIDNLIYSGRREISLKKLNKEVDTKELNIK